MLTINAESVYTKKELALSLGKSISTINRWCQNGLKHRGAYITGKAVLDYMENPVVESNYSKGMMKARKLL